jgi:hypothetical protein
MLSRASVTAEKGAHGYGHDESVGGGGGHFIHILVNVYHTVIHAECLDDIKAQLPVE